MSQSFFESITPNAQHIVFAMGNFWSAEAIFGHTKGCLRVVPGHYFLDGVPQDFKPRETKIENGENKLEVVYVQYDPDVVSVQTLVDIFFFSHDPTLLHWSGQDQRAFHTLHRSAIICSDEAQKMIALNKIESVIKEARWGPYEVNTRALDLAKNKFVRSMEDDKYYKRKAGSIHYNSIIAPKLDKLKQEFGDAIKYENAYLKPKM